MESDHLIAEALPAGPHGVQAREARHTGDPGPCAGPPAGARVEV